MDNKVEKDVPEVDYKDMYIRLLADVENIRKNSTKQIASATVQANEKMIKEILPFLDSMDLAIEAEDETHQVDVEVLRKQLLDILAKFGLKEIEIKPMETLFNDDVMNAVTIAPVVREEFHNYVDVVIKKGYTLNDTIIRHADVIVCSYIKQ